MPRSDDAYDLVHTYDQAKAGKSKTSRPAVREIGRDGAAVETYVSEEQTEADVRTPPSGVHLLFFNESGNLRQKDSTGTVSAPGGTAPSDASFVTVNSEGELSDERALSTGTGLSLTDAGAGNSLTVDADTLRGEPFVTTAAASSLSGETVAGVLSDVYGSPVQVGSGTDLRLATGQAIEDGSGNTRFRLLANQTVVDNENGNTAIILKKSDGYRYFAESSAPFTIEDREGNFDGVQYDTDTSSGVLRTPNAGIAVQENGTPSSGTGLEIVHVQTGERSIIRSFDRDNATREQLQIQGDPLELVGYGGLIDASQSGADLRLASGQSIEDGSGAQRLQILSSQTILNTQNGNNAFVAKEGAVNKINAYFDTPISIEDREGDFRAVKYLTSSSAPGTLELTNAVLDFQTGQASTTNDSMTANPETDTEDGFIEVDIAGTRFQIPAYSP